MSAPTFASVLDFALDDDDAPQVPPREVCLALLAELARMIALGGFARFVREPMRMYEALPKKAAPGAAGVEAAIARLCAYAGIPAEAAHDAVARFGMTAAGGIDPLFDLVGLAVLCELDPSAAAAPVDDALLRRGAIASIYAGLGVLALGAGREPGGALDLHERAFLVAVQSIIRDDDIPLDLDDVPHDAAFAWNLALIGSDDDLRAVLAIPPPADWPE